MRLCCCNSLVQSLLRMFLARQSIGFCWRGFNGLGSTRSSWRLQLRHTVAVFDGDEMESCSCSHFREKMLDRPFFLYIRRITLQVNQRRTKCSAEDPMNEHRKKNCHWIKFASDSNAEKCHWTNFLPRLLQPNNGTNPRMKEFAKGSWQDGPLCCLKQHNPSPLTSSQRFFSQSCRNRFRKNTSTQTRRA
jgi:hypothetical protein